MTSILAFLVGPIGRWVAGSVAVLAALTGLYFYVHHAGYVQGKAEVQATLDKLVDQTMEAGFKATLDNKLKEQANAKTISDALTARNDALNKLRLAKAGPGSGRLPSVTPAPVGSGNQCYDPSALASAIEKFRAGVEILVGEGDSASIDAKALIDSWPK
jgi:hypothetical protein